MIVLRITSRRDGFRRAGIVHPAVPVDHPIGELTEDQIEALRSERMLIVEEIDIPAPDDSSEKLKGRGKGTTAP